MKVKELQAEIEEALLRGLAIAQEFDPPCGLKRALTQDELEAFCRERANNLAQGLAWRTLTERNADTARDALWELAKDLRRGVGYEDVEG